MPHKVGDRLQTVVEKVVFGGPGLCRTPQGVVFVDFTAPQDEIEIEITEVKKDYARARLLQILKPSPDRTEPPCAYFGSCGGCDWQHLSAESQLRYKQELIEDLFTRNFSFNKVSRILASPQAFGYRNRIQLQGQKTGLSYTRKRSHDLLAIDRCMIAEDGINARLAELKEQVLEGRFQLTANGHQALAGESFLNEFSQVNTLQNEQLIRLVIDLAKNLDFGHFIDLYCGAGNFTFPLAETFPQVQGFGVDLDAGLIQKAFEKVESRKWPAKRLRLTCGSVDFVLPRIRTHERSLILLDPPRGGCGNDVSQLLSRIKATSLIYVSCNPMTLVRDLKIILGESRWELARVQPVDMFPQTSHIEVLVHLTPSSTKAPLTNASEG